MIRASAAYPAEDMIAIDRLMRSSDVVMARKQASYVEHERTVYEALREKFSPPGSETSLRIVAMVAIGAMRLALEAFNRDHGKRPIVEHLWDAFNALDREI